MGGYGVYFGDAETLLRPPCSTKIKATTLQNCGLPSMREEALIYPDSFLVVNGVLGWAQRRCRHKWHSAKGEVPRVDLWMRILQLTD